MGYMVMDSEKKTSVAFYGDVNGIPQDKPKIAVSYALAAQYMGMKLVYLEGGSGAPEPVPNEVIGAVKKTIEIPVVVGGGIRDGKTAYEKVKAGADIIGSNCGNGIENMIQISAGFRKHSSLPLLIQSNAGLPELKDGNLVYNETPQFMAEKSRQLLDLGVNIIGGCCGTTPEHIKAIRKIIDST